MMKLIDWFMEWVFPILFIVGVFALIAVLPYMASQYSDDMQACIADGHPAYYCRALLHGRTVVVQ